MSFLTDKSKLNVKTSNLSAVAKFSSTLDDAYFLIMANNSNSYGCNNSAAVFGANSSSNYEAYIGVANNNVINKLARFNNNEIIFNRNIAVSGNVVPSSNIAYDLGTPDLRWRDLYLSGNSIYVGQSVLTSDASSGSLVVKDTSNKHVPFIASQFKIPSIGSTSNYSIITSTDYGINLTQYDENDNEINHLDLGKGDTSMLPEGSNLYYTTTRFDERLLTKTLDDINNGTSNRFIINDVYSRDLHIAGSLYASNLTVYGDRTTLNTETYQTEQLQIISDANGPVLTVSQMGDGDVLHITSGSNTSLLVNNTGYVGINNENPLYNLDIVGTTRATFFKGDASLVNNVNLQDRDTSLLAEGSNLYYTSERVGIIATSSNLDTSNYIFNTSNEISSRLTDTSNVISTRLTDTSNVISTRLIDTSNVISTRLTDTSNVISKLLTETSNVISMRLTETSNVISNRITDLTTSEIFEGSNLFYTIQRFDERLLTKTLDDINNGTSNRFIINDVYNSDLKVSGTLTASNLIVYGTYTALDTVTYQTKKMEIVSDTESPALLIKQHGASNIMEVYDDSNIVLSIINEGYVGINILNPQHALDVAGTVNATSFIGDGIGLYNVNLTDRDTSMLAEGCNLYYTPERVGIISTSSNLETSNYILNSSNDISIMLTNSSNQFTNSLLNTSNEISTRITNLTTNEIIEGLNLYYTEQRFDTRLDTKTADYIAEGTSNKYIVNNVYNNDMTVMGTLIASNLVVSGDISILNTNTYQTERMEIISDVNGPALSVTQKGTSDILHIYDDEQIALAVIKGGNVGIHTITPEYTLDIEGTTRASYFIGDGSGMSNVNFQDRNTSMLVEGSNLYYTSERVGVIAISSNIETSNYIFNTSNFLITEIINTSNTLTNTINNVVNVEIDNTLAFLLETSNLLINNIVNTSNILSYSINETIHTEIVNTNSNLNYTSNFLAQLITSTSNQLTDDMTNVVNTQANNSSGSLTNTSNEIVNYIINTSNTLTDTINNVVSVQILNTSNLIIDTSNILSSRLTQYNTSINNIIDNLTTAQVAEGSNLYYTDSRFNSMLLTKTLNDIRNGTSNKYIINDKYDGDLYVTGTLITSNLTVNGNTTTLNTTTYQSKKLEIVSDAIGPALKVQQNGIFDIMQVYDDSNIVLSIVNGGRVGINTSNPQYTLDVIGTTRTNYLIGDGTQLTKVNLLDRDTNMLVEGSNLYYTSARVGVIATSSNINTSNYILNSSNAISQLLTSTSNQLDAYIGITSNNLYANLISSSNIITTNLLNTSNTLIQSLIDNSNLTVNTSNSLVISLQNTFFTATSNFTVNSNLLSSNILDTSNVLVNLVNNTYNNITGSITNTSNTLINNVLDTSNNIINFTNTTFTILNSNLNATSNLLTSNIPIIFNQLTVNLNNVSNIISSQINTNSNVITNTILTNSNLFVNRILDTSNVISNRITLSSNLISDRITNTSNEFASNLTLTSNLFNDTFITTSNSLYTYYNQTSNSLSADIVYNSNVIIQRINNLHLDMIKQGTSNTFITDNIYDANLTITGNLTVNSLDVIGLGLLELNETGDYINTDMKTYVARITSNVLLSAPSIIENSSINFDAYDINQSNYVATKQDIIKGSASSITNNNLLPNRVVITDYLGKLSSSSVFSSNLESIISLNAPVQSQINNLNLTSSNLALNILDQISLLNSSIGNNFSSGNNLSVSNTVSTCNLINIDPILYMKFENTNDASKFASKNYTTPKVLPSFSNHTSNLLLWYTFNNNTNNYINNADYNLSLINGIESYSTNINGINTLLLNSSNVYKMGSFNNIKPSGIKLFDNNDITMSFMMNTTNVSAGRQYIFSFATSNLFTNDSVIEAYINTNTLALSISKGANTTVYNVPNTLIPNIDYNVIWKISKNTDLSSSNALSQLNLNGVNFSNINNLLYPLNCNYTYNIIGGQLGTQNNSIFRGAISDFRVYNKSINDYEIDDNSIIKYPSYELHKNDLLLWYNFDGHLQNYDSQPKYVLTLTAGVMSFIQYTGLVFYSLYLNGASYYSMNTASLINLNTVSNIYPKGLTFTISFVPSRVNATQYLFSMTDTITSSAPTRSVEIFLTNTQLNFRIRQNGTTTMDTITLNSSLVALKKYTVSWVLSAGTNDTNASWYIYLNGANIYKSIFNRFYPTTASYIYNYIGSLYNTSSLLGYIDDFRVYKKALTPTEVMKINVNFISTKSFDTNTDNLISWYNFDNDNTNSIIDNTIPLMYLNFKDKKMMAYDDTNNYILVNNSSNITPIYSSINNFTNLNTSILNYSSDNSTSLSTNVNRYVYYTETIGISNVMNIINKKGFAMHFAFNTNVVSNNIPIYFFGNSTKSYINISVYYGALFIVIGDSTFKFNVYSKCILDVNTWYVVDIVASLKLGVMTFELYINNIKQALYGSYLNNTYDGSTSNLSFEYKGTNMQYGGETIGMYIGAYSPLSNTSNYNIADFTSGAVLTTTYYSSNTSYYDYGGSNNALKTAVTVNDINILKTSPNSTITFNSYINQANNNKYYAYRNSITITSNNLLDNNFTIDGANNLSLNSINSATIDSTLLELNGILNIDETGFYHFALDLQNEISCELVICSNDDAGTYKAVVASYYGGSLISPSNSIVNTNVLQYPIKLTKGFYKLYLKTLRKTFNSKIITAKYYKYSSYTGDYYSLNIINYSYKLCSQLSGDVVNNMIYINNKLLINLNGKIDKYTLTNAILTGNDTGLYSLGFSQYNYMGLGPTNVYDGKVLLKTQFSGGYYTIPGSGFIKISASRYIENFIIHNTGIVYCSGYNNNGNLGIGTITQQTTFVQVKGLNGGGFITGITDVSSGQAHSLFLHNSGIVYSCGANNFGQLGINSATQTFSTLQQVQGVNGSGFISGITQVSCGYAHSLFLHSSGIVYSCGNNANGQLGINSLTNSTTLKQVLGVNGSGFITGITYISVSHMDSFFIYNSDIVYCCGGGTTGNLGIDSTAIFTTLQQVKGVNGIGFISGITKVSTSGMPNNGAFTLFLHNTGIVYSCGDNSKGQLGLNNTTQYNTLQQVLGVNGVGFITGIIKVNTSGYNVNNTTMSSSFVHNTGIVYGCGDNTVGQLGIGLTASTTLKQVLGENGIGFATNIISVATGQGSTLYLDNNGYVYGSGASGQGGLGVDPFNPREYLKKITTIPYTQSISRDLYNSSNIIKVVPYSAGNSTTMANTEYSMMLDNSGAVYFTGEGGIHSANMSTDSYFTRISGLNNYNIIDIACGGSDTVGTNNYTLFLTNTGNVLYTPSNAFVLNSAGTNLSDIVSIACRKNNFLSYFINKSGDVFQGIVSGATSIANTTNVVGLGGVGILTNIKQVDAGLSYTIFLSNSGEVYSLGDNTYGQLGTGDNTTASTLTYMKGLDGVTNVKNIVKISCGNYYTLLLTKDMTVYATGYNVGGILGVGTTVNTNTLKQIVNTNGVGTLTGIRDISCGVANITPLYAAVLLLGNGNVYINGGANGTLKILTEAQTISSNVQSVYAAGSWLFLNTLKYDKRNQIDTNGYLSLYDESASSNMYRYVDNSYTVNIQDFRLYTPEIMGTSNIISTQLSKGTYNLPSVPYPNNILNTSNTTFDTNTYYSGYSSLYLNSSNNSSANLPANAYNFSSDTTISLWIKGDNSSMKYPQIPFTSNSSNCYSSFSNMDCYKLFDNNTTTSLNINSFTRLYGIGLNTSSKLGDNTAISRTSGYVPVIVPSTLNDIFTQIEGTSIISTATVHLLSDTGKAYALLSYGLSLLNPTYFNNEKVKFIASGMSSYFITQSGLLYAYGDNTYYQLGNGNTTTLAVPTLIPSSNWNNETIIFVSTGDYHTFIKTSSGLFYTIGLNTSGQLGNSTLTNQTVWTLFTAVSNIASINCSGTNTYITTNNGLLYSFGTYRGSTPFLESSIPSAKKIIKVSVFSGQCTIALADDGTVYGYGTNPISMPNITVAQTSFVELTSTVWSGQKVVDIANGGDHTFYTLNNGNVYVVGNNNYGQLNISTGTASSKVPLLVNIGGAKISLIYGGQPTMGYNIVSIYPTKSYNMYNGNYGEYISFDILNSSSINYARITLNTPLTTTILSYVISMKLYASNTVNTLNDIVNTWDIIGTYDGTLSYSASSQNIDIASLSTTSYRYYAVLINSRYNISIVETGVYLNSSITSKKTIFDACINENNYVNISLQSSNITASICNNSNLSSLSVSSSDIYSSGVLYTFSYKFNTDPTDSIWKVYTNGTRVKTATSMYYPETGIYSSIQLGKSVYSTTGVYNYFTGNLDDFRIYNKILSDEEVSKNYTSIRYNVEGYSTDNYINKYAIVSTNSMYVYNNNYNDTYNLLRNIDSNGFTIHFVFKTNDIINAPIYYIGGKKTSRLSIKVLLGMLYILLGSDMTIVSKTILSKDTWYIVDLVANIVGGQITLQLYLNGTISAIYNNNILNTKHTLNYSNILTPDNIPNTGIYLGAYDTVNKSTSNITNGAIFTNRYFSSNLISSNSEVIPEIISRTAINQFDFSNIIVNANIYSSYKLSSNVIMTDSNYYYNYDGSNYLYDNFITYNSAITSYILTEIDANIKLSTGYYYFINDITTDITAEMYIGIGDMKNVANYYGSNMTTVDMSLNKTSYLPIYIPDGYYKFHSKIYSKENRKYLHHKYIKLVDYSGDYYTLLNNIDYKQINTLDISITSNVSNINDNVFITNTASKNILNNNEGSIGSTIYNIGASNYLPTDYLRNLTSNYTIIGTSNYNINMTSNYTVNATSNYTINSTSNYTIGSTSNYIIDITSNYIVDTTSNYTVDTIDYTSNYTIDSTSNYTIDATSNYTIDATSNYTIDATSNYNVNYTSNYILISSITSNILATSNYNVIIKQDVKIPQILYGTNSIDTIKGIVNIANGASHTVVLKFDGTVMSIGYNINGQLGINTIVSSSVFVPVLDVNGTNPLTNILGISCGGYWSHFVKKDGTAYGCGLNTNGQLGDNTLVQKNRVVQILGVGGSGFITNVKQITGGFVGNNSTLFLKYDGTVYGCGVNTLGVLGDNTITQRQALVQMLAVGGVGFISNVKQIATNATSTYLLLNDGSVRACGGNTFGQLGDLTTTQRNIPIVVSGVDGTGTLANITQISANGACSHVLYLSNDGSVYGCGLNTSGQIGNNTITNVSYPTRVFNANNNGFISGISQIATTSTNSYFLRFDGSLLSCGTGTIGQLGNNTLTSSITPKYVMQNSSNILYGISLLSVGGANNVNIIYNNGFKQLNKDDSFYIGNNQKDNLEVLLQDFRIYNSGSLITSNLINLNINDNYSYITNYATYNEITDGNRWLKSKDYYLYTNGSINRSIYYNEGNVGIGTTAPTASLEIFTTDSSIYSVKTNNTIWAQSGVVSSSDYRIKKNIMDIEDLGALNQILKIEPKTYNYIDPNRGTDTVYGFIAQQINEVIPEAVSIHDECIPNIYKTGTVQNGNIITIDDDLTNKIHIGDSVDIVVKNGTKIRCEIMEIINDNMFRVNVSFDEETVFIYGVVVNDFHTIDKNYIYTLNVCATQDLYRQISSNQMRLEKQTDIVKSLIQRMSYLDSSSNMV